MLSFTGFVKNILTTKFIKMDGKVQGDKVYHARYVHHISVSAKDTILYAV